MKKIYLILIGLFTVFGSIAQESKPDLKTRIDVIRNETVAGANTKTRIANAYQEIADGMISIYPVSASGTDTYTGSLQGLDAYSGRIVFVSFANNNTGAATLNIGGIGAANIQKYDEGWTALEADDIVAGKLYRLYHDGTRFQIDLGGGGGAGLVDGDYGDITVGGDGTTMTVNNLAITNAKINDVAVGKITGLGTGVATAIAVNVGSAGAPVINGGALGTPSSGTGTNITGIVGTNVTNTPAGNISATTSQAAINELDTEKQPLDSDLTTIAGLTATTDNFIQSKSSAWASRTVAQVAADLAPSLVKATITNGVTDSSPSQDATFDALALKADKFPTVNVQTSNYILALSDASNTVRTNNASANTITIPPSGTVDFADNTYIEITQYNSGTTTIVAGVGVTIRSVNGTLVSPGQYAVMLLKNISGDEWFLWGDKISAASLTKTDDTNVTLTLSGSPTTSLLTPVAMTLGWTGTLGVDRGGTAANNTTQTYTPTLTNSANIAASTARQCTYFRVGNAVTVSGQLDIDPTTTATLTTMGISLPIASDFSTAFQAGGTAAATTVTDGAAGIISDATNNRATLQYMCVDVSNHTMAFSFTYQIL